MANPIVNPAQRLDNHAQRLDNHAQKHDEYTIIHGMLFDLNKHTTHKVNSLSENTSALEQLSDVNINSAANGDTLVYDSTTSEWVNSATSGEVPLTFSTGLTRTTNTITNNLSTGVAGLGGQTAIGGTGITDILKLQGTTANGTSGNAAIQAIVGNNGATIALTVLNSGDVGIGTTSPAYPLDVNGSAKMTTIRDNTNSVGTSGQLLSSTGSAINWITPSSAEVPLTFSTGLTRTTNTITNNLSTGVAGLGGQTAIGGTGATDILTLKGTTGNGTLGSAAIQAIVGNNGATTALTVLNSGDVGIGTITPTSKLHIVEPSTTSGSIGILVQKTGVVVSSGNSYGVLAQTTGASTTNYGGFFTASGGTNNYGLVVSAGRTGLGTTAPDQQLHLKDSVNGFVGIRLEGSNGSNASSDYSGADFSIFASSHPQGTANDFLGFQNNSTTDSASQSYKMVITKQGNVGIGTTTPGYRLAIINYITGPSLFVGGDPSNSVSNGIILLQSGRIPQNGSDTTGTTGLLFQHTISAATTVNGGYIYNGREKVFSAASEVDTYIAFATTLANTNNERMRITAGGYVGVGTTSPGSRFSIQGEDGSNTSTFSIKTKQSGTAAFQTICRIDPTGSSVNDGIMQILDNGAPKISMAANSARGGDTFFNTGGNFGIGTTTPLYQLQLSTDSAAKPTSSLWTIASDSRVKENVTPYTKGLAELLKINPVNYDYNGLGGFKKGKGGVGIIAQEIIDILPDSVNSVKGKLNETDTIETGILNFNGHELIYVLVNAIKEQQVIINSLLSRITVLESK